MSVSGIVQFTRHPEKSKMHVTVARVVLHSFRTMRSCNNSAVIHVFYFDTKMLSQCHSSVKTDTTLLTVTNLSRLLPSGGCRRFSP